MNDLSYCGRPHSVSGLGCFVWSEANTLLTNPSHFRYIFHQSVLSLLPFHPISVRLGCKLDPVSVVALHLVLPTLGYAAWQGPCHSQKSASPPTAASPVVAMGRYSSAGILLIVVNVGFLVAGALLLKFSLDLKSTGWLDALDETEYKSAASTLVTAVMALGVGTIMLALVGILGTTLRSRMLLMFYSGLMILAMIIFGVIGGTAFSFNSKMKKWEDATFPAETSENDFAVKFNEIYCYAQGAYFCNNATTTDLITIFFPTVPAEAAAALPKVQGLNSLCKSGTLSLLGNVDGVCAACKQAEKFAKFDKILTWAEEKCPRTAMTSLWCAAFLESGSPGAVYDKSPYKQCRESFLDIAISWGTSLTVYGLLSFIAAAALLALSCFTRRSRYSGSEEGTHKV